MSHEVVKISAWNTGNGYTAKGQRIGYCVMKDKSIIFSDVDRMIDGLIPRFYKPEEPTESRIMAGYMHSEADYWSHGDFDYMEYAELRKMASSVAFGL